MTGNTNKIKDVHAPQALYDAQYFNANIVGYRVIVEYETGGTVEKIFDATKDGQRFASDQAKQFYADRYMTMCIQRSARTILQKNK